jgi:hypothetical protein
MGVKQKSVKLSTDVWASTQSGNVYEYAASGNSRTDPAHESKAGTKIVKWGIDNLLPYHLRQLLADNDIKQQLINTDVDLACGKGLILVKEIDPDQDGKKEIQFVKDQAIDDWMEAWDLESKFREVMLDLKEFGNSWFEFIFSRDRSRVNSCKSLDAVDCRIRKPEKTNWKIDTLVVADWKYPALKKEDMTEVPLIKSDWSDFGQQTKQAVHLKKQFSGQPFYSLVEWFGSRIWSEISGLIAKFHLAGLKGGFSLRYHIKIPLSYLEDRVAALKNDGKTETAAVAEIKRSIQNELDAVLGGADNAQKSFMSWVNDHMPSPTGWEISKIDTDLKDDSYIKLSDAADKKHARGHNIHPVLAGIETTGSMSSGSEITNLLNYHTAYKTPGWRKLALKPFNKMLQINFPEQYRSGIRIGVEDVQITTLDKNPTGTQNVNSNV